MYNREQQRKYRNKRYREDSNFRLKTKKYMMMRYWRNDTERLKERIAYLTEVYDALIQEKEENSPRKRWEKSVYQKMIQGRRDDEDDLYLGDE